MKWNENQQQRKNETPIFTKPEIIAKIIYLRQTFHFDPWKIQMYLKRYHDIHICSSGVWRILKRLNMNRLPYNQRYKKHKERWKRYEKPEPGHRIQVDVKFLEKITGWRILQNKKSKQGGMIISSTLKMCISVYRSLCTSTYRDLCIYPYRKLCKSPCLSQKSIKRSFIGC